MERKVILGVLGFSLLVLGAALLLPSRAPDPDLKVPWRIAVDAQGHSQVFGITLGKSTLAEVRQILAEEGEISLFAMADGQYAVETYFQQLFLSGLRADMVMTLDIAPEEAEAMYSRGFRIAKMGSGEKKVTLAPEDVAVLAQRPIRHITYLPKANLDEALLIKRFGEPARRIVEPSGVVHLLYPDQGLDIAVDQEAKEVFQYVLPTRFAELIAPLQQAAESAGSLANPQ